MPSRFGLVPLGDATLNESLAAVVCLAMLGKSAPFNPVPARCSTSTFQVARCGGRMLGEPPHFSSPEHSPSLTYAEKACVDRRLQRALRDGSCLVYGVGVANDWSFERSLAAEGCEVHLFDPTVSHPPFPDPFFRNISFHPWGVQHLGASAFNGSAAARAFAYGSVHGEL